jgi:plasmid stabilization system protein ParE
MTVVWRPKARAEFVAAVRYLKDRNEVAARKLRDAVVESASLLSRQPLIARESAYPGFRAWSLPKWSKILVFRITSDGIEVVALLDTRSEAPDAIE